MAVSFILIQHYNALFERACDAVYAYSNAVNLVYGRQGFVHRNYQVRLLMLIAHPFFLQTLHLREKSFKTPSVEA